MERESLWFKVLSARYGLAEGKLREGGCHSSLWLRNIVELRREEWFRDNVKCGVGNGERTLFWSNVWVGDVPLRVRFPRLFDLSCCKEVSVAGMCQLGWRGCGGGGCLPGRS